MMIFSLDHDSHFLSYWFFMYHLGWWLKKIRWDNVIITLLLVSVIVLSLKYYEVSKEFQPGLVIMTPSNCSKVDFNFNHFSKVNIVKFDDVGFKMTDLSQQSGNILINIYRIELNNESIFVLSPQNSLYFTTGVGDVSIINQTSDYAIIFANESVIFSYDNSKLMLIPGFSGLWLIIDKSIIDYYTYDVYLNEDSIKIINNKTGFNRTITNVHMINIKVDKINFIVYSSRTPVIPVSLPTRPFSIIKVHVPKDSMFTGLTSNGVNELEFHFIKEGTANYIGYFVGMINTFGVISQANNIFFLYSD